MCFARSSTAREPSVARRRVRSLTVRPPTQANSSEDAPIRGPLVRASAANAVALSEGGVHWRQQEGRSQVPLGRWAELETQAGREPRAHKKGLIAVADALREESAMLLQPLLELYRRASGRKMSNATKFLERLCKHLAIVAYAWSRKAGWLVFDKFVRKEFIVHRLIQQHRHDQPTLADEHEAKFGPQDFHDLMKMATPEQKAIARYILLHLVGRKEARKTWHVTNADAVVRRIATMRAEFEDQKEAVEERTAAKRARVLLQLAAKGGRLAWESDPAKVSAAMGIMQEVRREAPVSVCAAERRTRIRRFALRRSIPRSTTACAIRRCTSKMSASWTCSGPLALRQAKCHRARLPSPRPWSARELATASSATPSRRASRNNYAYEQRSTRAAATSLRPLLRRSRHLVTATLPTSRRCTRVHATSSFSTSSRAGA